MEQWIVAFIVVDIIITAVVVFFIFRARAARTLQATGTTSILSDLQQMGALMEFTKQRYDRIADYVRSNWSGIPDQLPGVLTSLVDQLENEAKAQGHKFSRELLKTMVATTLQQRKVVPGDQVGAAIEKVA
jgi:hypothetical protein